MSDLFRFEVPTSKGVFVIIGPDDVPKDEAEKIGARISRLLPLFMLGPEEEADDEEEDDDTELMAGDPFVTGEIAHPPVLT